MLCSIKCGVQAKNESRFKNNKFQRPGARKIATRQNQKKERDGARARSRSSKDKAWYKKIVGRLVRDGGNQKLKTLHTRCNSSGADPGT